MKHLARTSKKNKILSSSLAIVLALSVVLTTFSGLFTFAGSGSSNEIEVWDGTVATSFADGNGTSADPYKITNGSELLLAISSTGRDSGGNKYYYSLENDIYLNDVTNLTWKNWTANEWPSVDIDATTGANAFGGVFSGNGNRVYGIYLKKAVSKPTTETPDTLRAAGLFPVVAAGAEISGVGVENSYIALTNDHSDAKKAYAGYVGTLIGYMYNNDTANPIKVENCYSAEDVNLLGAFVGFIGGVSATSTGTEYGATVKNCYALSSGSAYNDDAAYANNNFRLISGPACESISADYCYVVGQLGWGNLKSATGSNYCTDTYAGSSGGSIITTFESLASDIIYKRDYTSLDNNATNLADVRDDFDAYTSAGLGSVTPSGKNTAIKGLTVSHSSSQVYADLAVNAKNFVVKINFVTTENNVGYASFRLLDSNKSTSSKTYVAFTLPYSSRNQAVHGQVRADYGNVGFRGLNQTEDYVNVNELWTLTTPKNEYTLHIYSYEEKVYFTTGDGTIIAECNALSNTGYLRLLSDWGGMLVKSIDIRKLESGTVATPLADMKGEGALNNMPKLNGDNAYATTDSYPRLVFFVQKEAMEQVEIWDGGTAAPTKGAGTEDDPILIENAKHLAHIIKNNGGADKFYKLTTDIFLNDVNKIDWTTGEPANGYSPKAWYSSWDTGAWRDRTFNGTIDGDGHTVYGLYYNETGNKAEGYQGTGLIPRVEKGNVVTIKDLKIDACYISRQNSAGAFVGFMNGSDKGYPTVTLDRCSVGASATISAYDAGAFVGRSMEGMLKILNCYSLAEVAGTHSKGFFGDIWGVGATNSVIKYCYNANGPISSIDKVNTMAFNYATEQGAPDFVVTVLDRDYMKGLDVLTNTSKMPKLGLNFKATSGFPVHDYDYVAPPSMDDIIWDKSTDKLPTKGTGAKEDPYLIETPEHLAAVVKSGGGEKKYYKLTADLYINDPNGVDWSTGEVSEGYDVRNWLSTSTFKGTIDGDGHKVYGLYFKSTSSKDWGWAGAGLIPKVNTGDTVVIKNLGVEASYLEHANNAAAFVGFNGGRTSIENCYVGSDVTVYGHESGAFIALSANGSFSLTSCYSLATTKQGPNKTKISNYGLVGEFFGGTFLVQCCYNANGPITNSAALTVDKYNYATENTEHTKATILTAQQMKGLDVLSGAMNELNKSKAYIATDSHPVLKVFVESSSSGDVTSNIWNGLVAGGCELGSGTESDPFIITNGSELAWAVTTTEGYYFELDNDIYLNDVVDNGWYLRTDNNEWFNGTSFKGNIDGKGFCVYGIWYPDNNEYKYTGFVPKMQAGTIKNLGIRYSYIVAYNFAAGFTAYIEGFSGNNVTFEQCFVDDTVRIKFLGTETWENSSFGAGGFVGYLYGYDQNAENPARTVVINNCYSKATLEGTSTNRMNGMIGTIWLSNYSIKNSYSIGYPVVNATNHTMADDYYDHSSKLSEQCPITDVFENNYTDVGTPAIEGTYTTIDNIKNFHGDNAKTYLAGLDYTKIWETVTNGTPKLKIFTSISGEDISMPDPTGTFYSGKGTKNDPYIIKTAQHLRNMVNLKSTAGKYFQLANDIYLNDVSKSNWMVNSPAKWYDSNDVETFSGTLDGQGYSIYGLFVNSTPLTGNDELGGSYTGLIPKATFDTTIKNVHIRNSYISGKSYAGAFVGYVSGSSKGRYVKLIGCSADETVTVKGQTAGGLIGGGSCGYSLYYCYFTGSVSGTSDGREHTLVGDVWNSDAEVVQCYSTGGTAFRGVPQNTYVIYGTEEQNKTTVLTKAQMTGSNAKKNMSGLFFDTYWYIVDGKTPQLKVVDASNLGYTFIDEGVKGRVWSGKRATKFAGGKGTETEPYLIETPEQLAYMIYFGSSNNKYYKLVADIKLNDTSKKDWEANANEWFSGKGYGGFQGNFDGNGHIVSGLYYNTSNTFCGLFPYVQYNATIRRIGITDSSIINVSVEGQQSYSGALIGYIESWNMNADTYRHAPIISECFVDHSVYIEGFFAAGLAAGCAQFCEISDCYVTCELTGTSMTGAFVATAWRAIDGVIVVKNSYASTVNSEVDMLINNGMAKSAEYINVYHDGKRGNANEQLNILSLYFMQGHSAKEHLKGFDWNSTWKTVEGGSPVLRCFYNADKYSCKREPNKVAVTFSTGCAARCEPLYGYGYTDLDRSTLPTPERYGYKFAGWFYTQNYAIEFDLDHFPPASITVYAKWEKVGYENGFEGVVDEIYDISVGAIHHRPGVDGYNMKYVRSGLKSLKLLADSDKDPRFLINYEFPLEVAQEYEISFYIKAISEEAKGAVKFFHADKPQHYSGTVGYEEVLDLSELTVNTWKQHKVTIVANAPYIIVSAPKGYELAFDDFQIVPTFKEGELGKIDGYNPSAIGTEPSGLLWWHILLICVGGIVVLGGAAVAVIFVIKKKNAKVPETEQAE
ncbi:MAG: InlB B-repeat-containing protein [Clostridia bacterium]|nr:InlB B-repeat-containing protein [Clostridia bacterium]